MTKKIFILGVGCQKGGTTWLHRQLNHNTHVDMGFRKEYHVFNTLYRRNGVSNSRLFLRLEKRIRLARNNDASRDALPVLLKHMGFLQNTDNYFNYFDNLWLGGSPLITHVGDITPAYATLPAKAFEEIKTGLESRGFRIKVIFIMRDPIERCWSAVRMSIGKRIRNGELRFLNDEIQLLEEIFRSTICERRTRYEETVETLEKVFDSRNIFYCIYENLGEQNTLQSIRNFLNIDNLGFEVANKIFQTKRTDQVPNPELECEIYRHYENTYRFCAERFGTRKIWRGYQYES